jgi:hypothetical protein
MIELKENYVSNKLYAIRGIRPEETEESIIYELWGTLEVAEIVMKFLPHGITHARIEVDEETTKRLRE